MSAKMDRLGIGADILISMEQHDDLPLPNMDILSRTMMKYFKQEGLADDLAEMDYTWRPTSAYWRRHIREVASLLATDRRKPFCFYREWGTFRGLWKFCTKQEYKDMLYRDHADLSTRTERFNERLDDVSEKWKIDIPFIPSVPLLTN